jgi:bacterioferritin-associated ferredoxin
MIVCVCRRISDQQIRQAMNELMAKAVLEIQAGK